MVFETELTRKSRDYVEKFLQENIKDHLFYHDFQHSRDVAEATIEIGKANNLSDDDLETVIIAAWFHDTGYLLGMDNHETESKNIASEFLRSMGVNEKKIAEVGGCIIATKMPQRPTNLMEEVLCDADLHHLSSDEFFAKSELLRKELSARSDKEIKNYKWFKKSLKFLKEHNFFTPYARENLLPTKELNVDKLKILVKELKGRKSEQGDKSESGPDTESDIDKEMTLTGTPERGVETLFRITSKNHIDFSSMADNKAHIMISINSILISILFSVLFRRFEEYPNLIFPSIVLALTCLTTMVFAILATRPNFTRGTFTREDIEKRRTNLLFFGNFHKMPIENYEWGMKRIITDSDFLYSSMIRDIYFLGKVLGRKYQLLRISYTVFMYGFIVSVIAFTLWVFYLKSANI
jgi:predicted metal-dependent HD superfamily phosphohydrolase